MSWQISKLSEVSKVVDSLHQTPKYSEAGYPMVRVTDVKGGYLSLENTYKVNQEVFSQFSKNHKPKQGDIIITRVGSYGLCSYVNTNSDFCLGQNTAVIIPEINNKFLYYVISSHIVKNQIEALITGSSYKSISLGHIRNLEIPTPLLQTQKRIADILSAYDDLIENNLKRIKLLEKAAQNIYKEWFVNMRFPDHENTPIDQETGLPEGWRKVALQNISTVQSSKRVFLSDYVENGIPFYRGKEITQKSRFEEISEPLFISQEKFNELEEKSGSPKKDDILITGVGTIGNCYLIKDSDLPFYFKDGNLLWLNSYKEGVSGVFLIHYLQSPVFEGVVNSICIGSSQKALTITALKKIEINLPNPEIITHFESIVSSFIKQIEVLGEATKKLKAARDILLPRLMNQTIEV